jgi:2-C-methyl-D-erythritol 4-phosphate cytidylyltransferase
MISKEKTDIIQKANIQKLKKLTVHNMKSHLNNEKLGLIIAAGGTGNRYSKQKYKLFEKLNNTPLFIITLKNFIDILPEENIILVINKDFENHFKENLKLHLPNKTIKLIYGGIDRMHSVYNGLQALPKSIEYVAVHDAARPYASGTLLKRCFETAANFGSAIPAKRVTDTLKIANNKNIVKQTLNREQIWAVETPQVFKIKELIKAYAQAFKEKFSGTDDASVMENAGYRPYLLENSDTNIKITYERDII